MKRIFAFLTSMIIALGWAGAQPLAVHLVSPLQTAPAGATVELEIVVLNTGENEAAFAPPAEWNARLSDERGQTWDVRLQPRAGGESMRVAPGGYARTSAALALPADAYGRLVLELDQPARARALIEASGRPPVVAGGSTPSRRPGGPSERASSGSPSTPDRPATAAGAAPPATASLLRSYYAQNFSVHEPIYFLYGPDAPGAKFQLSFKYRLPADDGPIARRLPILRGLQIGYTQRSLWDIDADSSPFFDTSYMPEIMHEYLAAEPEDGRFFHWLGVQSGLQHESNGRDGANSRSMNIAYVRPAFAFGDLDAWHLIVAPRLFVYLESEDNPDIHRYRGYGELRAVFGKNDGPTLGLTGRLGSEGDRGSLQVDFTIPTDLFSGSFASYLHAQYWLGYGESLLFYNRHTSTVRFGFSLVR